MGDNAEKIADKTFNEIVTAINLEDDSKMAEIFSFLKFGQPSAIKLSDGTFLMCHWVCEDGVYKTIATKFEL